MGCHILLLRRLQFCTRVIQPTGIIAHANFYNEQRIRDILFRCLVNLTVLRFRRNCMSWEIFCRILQLSDVTLRTLKCCMSFSMSFACSSLELAEFLEALQVSLRLSEAPQASTNHSLALHWALRLTLAPSVSFKWTYFSQVIPVRSLIINSAHIWDHLQ